MARQQNKGALGSFWTALGPWSKGAVTLLPILAVAGIAAPFAVSTIGTPPFESRDRGENAHRRLTLVEQRIDLQERIALQREVLKLEEEARRRRLSESEKNYLQDLRDRLKELERRK